MSTRTPNHTREPTDSGEKVPVAQEIRYWMRTPAITVSLAAPLSEALVLMREHEVRRLPVVDDTGALCGMITQGDIRGADVLRAAGMDLFDVAGALQQITVSQVMAEQPIAITPATGLREAAMLMIENKIGGLPVIDVDNMVVGIITESDLFEALVQQLDNAAIATWKWRYAHGEITREEFEEAHAALQ